MEDLAALLSCEQLNQVHKLGVLEGEREDCVMVREIKSSQTKLELDLVLLLEEAGGKNEGFSTRKKGIRIWDFSIV